MKKTVLFILSFAIFSAAIFADSAEILSVKGKVEVSRNGSWVALNVGDKVNENEMISTGFQSEAKVKINNSVMQIGALSRLTLNTLASSGNKEVVDVYLNTGAVRSKVSHTEDRRVNYTVRSPVAVASVRGTEFILFGNGAVSCAEGAVAVSPAKYYKNSAAQDVESSSVDEVESPADGESNANTSATDIDPYSPAGAVVVSKGQGASVSGGAVSAPSQTASNGVSQGKGSVSTQGEKESVYSVSVSAVSSSSSSGTSESGQQETPSTGSVDVTVEFE